jgi:hypothetical protein
VEKGERKKSNVVGRDSERQLKNQKSKKFIKYETIEKKKKKREKNDNQRVEGSGVCRKKKSAEPIRVRDGKMSARRADRREMNST